MKEYILLVINVITRQHLTIIIMVIGRHCMKQVIFLVINEITRQHLGITEEDICSTAPSLVYLEKSTYVD